MGFISASEFNVRRMKEAWRGGRGAVIDQRGLTFLGRGYGSTVERLPDRAAWPDDFDSIAERAVQACRPSFIAYLMECLGKTP